MPTTYSIDQVRPAEAGTLLEFIIQLASFQGHPDKVTNTRDQLASDLTESWFEAYFLRQKNQIIGSSILYYKYSSWKGKALHIDELYIIPSARRSGWGTILFNFILDLAREKGCAFVSWSIAPDNDEAIRFYKTYEAEIRQYWLDASLTIS